MAFKDTINAMRQHLIELSHDLEKATAGNRAAAQRVRTGSIKFAKTAKLFRKESILAEKEEDKKVRKSGKVAKKMLAKPLRKKR